MPKGTVTMKALPRPTSLSTLTSPPWSRTSSLTKASPMPLPSKERPRALLTRWKRSNSRGSSSAGMPVPVSRTVSRTAVADHSQRNLDLALEGELEGVGEEVQHDLLPHLAVDVDRLRERRAIDDQLSPARSTAERKTLASSAVRVERSVGSNEAWMRPASIREKSSSVLTSLSSRSALRCASSSRSRFSARQARRVRERVLERPHHERQRRAELVADVGEELRLQLVELGELLALAGDLALVGLLLGDVASLGRDEHDLAALVLDRHQRGVDDDRFLAAGAPVDLRVPADELALRRRARSARAGVAFTSSETCHQKVVQKGLPSTSASVIPTASRATLLISSTVPFASRRPTNWTMESSVIRAIFSR